MEQKTIDKLIELNKLYEAGILTKEEIEAEKQKLLLSDSEYNASQETSVSETVTAVTVSTENNEEQMASDNTLSTTQQTNTPPTSNMKRTWWIIGGVVILCVVIALIISNSKESLHKESWNSYNDEIADTDITDDDIIIEDETGDFTIDDDSDESYGLWYKDYFTNEWGEEMPEHPFIIRYVRGESSYSLNVLYSHEIGFRFHLTDDERDHEMVSISSVCNSVSLLFRDADGDTYEIEPDEVDNDHHMVYVRDADNIRFIAQLLNSGKCNILMKYGLYLEPHSSKWTYNDMQGDFFEAVEELLP